jgi:hypothetical protein
MGSLIMVGFGGISIFAIFRSKERVRIVLYIVLWIVVGFVCAFVLGYFVGFSGSFAGEFALDLSLLCGMLAALIHSRRSRTKITPSTSHRLEDQP